MAAKKSNKPPASGPKVLQIMVPGPVTPKGRPRFVCRGGFPQVFTPKQTADYEAHIRACGIAAIKASGWTWTEDDRYRVTMVVTRQAARADADNFLKLLDGLNKVAFLDDRLIVEAHVYIHDDDKKNPRLEIEVEKI